MAVISGHLALMSRQPESSRLWSCDTLQDGIDHLSKKVQDAASEGAALEQFLQDIGFSLAMQLKIEFQIFQEFLGI